ncbi:hypothetical protein ACROYT_G009107 [Oculina patagonica]
MSSANVLPSAPAYGDREETQLYPSLPTNAENFRLTEISKIEKEISAEAEHYRLVLKKYKKVRKVIHYSVVCLGAVTAALSSGAVATSLTGVGIVIGVPVAAVAGTYSNLYNHPTLIKDSPKVKPIKLSKAGIPLGVLSQGGSNKPVKTNEDMEAEEIQTQIPHNTIRSRDETKEEKKQRKQEVKNDRKVRRMEKKANKIAFKSEKQRQEQSMLHTKQQQGKKL